LEKNDMMKICANLMIAVLLAVFSGCQHGKDAPSVPVVHAQPPTPPEKQTELLALFRQKHPEHFDSMVIYCENPSGNMLLFLVKRGGTYIFQPDSGEVETIHHAKRIQPSQITKIEYQDGAFNLWASDHIELSIGVSK
jgi:hypothetical protein